MNETKEKKTENSPKIKKKMGLMPRLALVGVVLILFFSAAIYFLNRGMDKISALTITNPELSSVTDGDHRGTYCEGRWCYDVTVTVKEHAISDIRLNNDKMKMFNDLHAALIKKIIEQQRIDVDAVSGATITSKAFLKAVENAVISR
ncbi:MAG TPA: FMN-binding protein [Chitinispirillaceae bacterium]|nr:FMN-binding protein [Chitinispirillaceae bacterium]